MHLFSQFQYFFVFIFIFWKCCLKMLFRIIIICRTGRCRQKLRWCAANIRTYINVVALRHTNTVGIFAFITFGRYGIKGILHSVLRFVPCVLNKFSNLQHVNDRVCILNRNVWTKARFIFLCCLFSSFFSFLFEKISTKQQQKYK